MSHFALFFSLSILPHGHGSGLGDESMTSLRATDLVIFIALFLRIVAMFRGPELTLSFYVPITIGV